MSEHSDISAVVWYSFHWLHRKRRTRGGSQGRQRGKERRGGEAGRRRRTFCLFCVYLPFTMFSSHTLLLSICIIIFRNRYYPILQLKWLRLKEVTFLTYSYKASIRVTPELVFPPLHKADFHAVPYLPVFLKKALQNSL